MTPLRRGRGGRRPPPLGSRQARKQAPDEGTDGDAETGEKAAAKSSEKAPEAEKLEATRAKETARAERVAQEREAKATKAARKERAKPSPDRPPVGKRLGGAVGTAAKGVGTRVHSALTGPRAKKAATTLDNGLVAVWRWLLAGLKSLLAGLLVIGRLVLGGLQELWAFWIRTAELLGGAILLVERTVRPIVLAVLRAARRALAFAERVVTPQRAVAVVVAATAVVLAASQFVDYRGVQIGAPAYAGVENVAPAPQTDRQTTGSVHGYAMVPVAVVVIVATLLALRGRWRVARVIPVLGALAIAVTLLLDARRGLDEGEAGIAYEGTKAVLIEGFWLQLASASVLVVTGLLLIHYARLQTAPAARRRSSRRSERPGRRRRFRIAGVRA